MIIEIALLIALYLTWTVGANTLGATIGIVIGSGIFRLRGAVIFAGIFAVAGAVLLSGRIIETVGNKFAQFDAVGVLAIMATAGILATVLSWRGMPISLTYLIIGGVAGYSFGAGIAFNITLYAEVIISLFTSPLISMFFGFLLYYGIRKVKLDKLGSIQKRESLETRFFLPTLASFALLAFMIGVDSVGVAVGVLSGAFGATTLGLIGSAGIVVGLLTWSYKVAKTVGIRITDLSPIRGFTAYLVAGLVAVGFLTVSIPVSISQTTIGAIVGVGLARGRVEKTIIADILKSWVIALPSALVLSALFGFLL